MKKVFFAVFVLCIAGNIAFAQCTCTAGCSSLTVITMPFSKDGAGEVCFQASCIGTPINSWNLDKLTINGMDFTNKWADASTIPAAAGDGTFYIYYKASYSYSHFEASGSCSGSATTVPADTPAPTAAPVDTSVPTAVTIDTPAPTAAAGTPNPTGIPTVTPGPTATPGPTTVTVDTSAPTAVTIDTPAPTAVIIDTPVPTTVTINTAAPTTPPGGAGGSVPWLHTDGKYIKDASGSVAPLYGVSLPCITVVADSRTVPGDSSKTNVQRYIDIATNASDGWYANVIRLPVYPDWFSDETGSHQGWMQIGGDAYFSTYLDPAIQYCIEKQVYAIIDWHYIGQSWTDPTVVSNTNAFWTYVPPKYANCSNVIFEIFNEPTGGITLTDWNSWKIAADAWVSMIRQAAPNNLILVGAPSFSQDLTYVPQNPINGTNIVYVAHLYPAHDPSNWDSWFGNTADSYPVMITEWGYESGAPYPCDGTQSTFGDAFKSYINSKDNIRWTAWCFDYIWRPAMWDTNWNLLSGTSYMGQFVKTWIDEKL